MTETAEAAVLNTALKVAQGIADRHPGPQYDHKVTGTVIEIHAKHPQHNWGIGIDLSNPEVSKDPERRGKFLATQHLVSHWMSRLLHVMRGVQVTNANGHTMTTEDGVMALVDLMRKLKPRAKFMMIGNGGSAGIASHMAEDFTKNGKVRAVTFNDAALLTCYANDYGWEQAFGRCVEHHGDAGDVLIGISSSGNSKNIREAVMIAKAGGIVPVTFSGFDNDNPLRTLGQLNFYVPSHQYGFVETAHAGLLHLALDIHMGWVGQL